MLSGMQGGWKTHLSGGTPELLDVEAAAPDLGRLLGAATMAAKPPGKRASISGGLFQNSAVTPHSGLKTLYHKGTLFVMFGTGAGASIFSVAEVESAPLLDYDISAMRQVKARPGPLWRSLRCRRSSARSRRMHAAEHCRCRP